MYEYNKLLVCVKFTFLLSLYVKAVWMSACKMNWNKTPLNFEGIHYLQSRESDFMISWYNLDPKDRIHFSCNETKHIVVKVR